MPRLATPYNHLIWIYAYSLYTPKPIKDHAPRREDGIYLRENAGRLSPRVVCAARVMRCGTRGQGRVQRHGNILVARSGRRGDLHRKLPFDARLTTIPDRDLATQIPMSIGAVSVHTGIERDPLDDAMTMAPAPDMSGDKPCEVDLDRHAGRGARVHEKADAAVRAQ